MKQPIKFTIRKARTSDYKEVNALFLAWEQYHHELLPKILKPPKSKTHIRRGTFINLITDHDTTAIVAVVAEQVIGLVEVIFDNVLSDADCYAIKRASIDYIYVVPKYRRNGIGHALVEAAAVWAKQKKREVLTVSVYTVNVNAAKLYRQAKFEPHITRLNRAL